MQQSRYNPITAADRPIILASGSRYRAELLKNLRLPFTTYSPNIDESAVENESAKDTAQRLALQKAQACAANFNTGLVIGSDQVAELSINNKPPAMFGKPLNNATAIRQLTMCSGQSVHFYTGLTVLDIASKTYYCMCEMTEVVFRKLTDTQIQRYIEVEQPLDCAGSFKCEGLGIRLFTAIHGRDPNALIGLPLIGLTDLLAKFGVDPLFFD